MYISTYTTNRPAPVLTHDMGLGNPLWVKLREKLIKPVGRAVAAYYTAGGSEVAYAKYKQQDALKKMNAQQKAEYANALASINQGQVAPGTAQGFAAMQGQAMNVPRQPPMPDWVIPAAIGAGALVLVVAMRR